MSNKNSIQVAIKVRPLLRKEKNMPIFWRVKENTIQLEGGAGDPYYFDHIFDHDSNNELIFETMAKHIVHAAIKGFNGTIFAYGQTSSGKTYTMIGDENNPGVMVLAAKEIFKEIERTTDRQFLLRVGYIEIYNEKIYDLLKKQNTDLKIHETTAGHVSVACEEVVITSEDDLLRYLCLGNKERTTGETQMNERSSRSHAIFRIIIESRKVERSEDDAIIQSVLNLVDLAGSERADQTGATGARLKEGGHINKSLLFLSTVIKRLSENEDDSFISFRDSKLTRILQASLGGNALTSVICTIKPTAVDETQSTLSFALRAKNVKNKPQVNEIVTDSTMMKRLEREIKLLKSRLEEERNKNESQLKVGQLEQHLKTELFKFITSNSLNNVRKLKENRRRTWCPNTENGGNDLHDVASALLPPTPAVLSRIPTKTNPHKTTRSANIDVSDTPFVRGDTFVKSKLQESSEEQFVPGEICNFDVTPPFNEPEITERVMRTLSLTPMNKNHHNDNIAAIENDMLELQEFVDLEKQINVQHDVLELDLKKTHTQLQHYKRRSDDFQQRINILEEANAIANEKIIKYETLMTHLESTIKELKTENQNLVGLDIEFERLRNKSKIRENELLELLEEKNIKLQQLQKSLDSTILKHSSTNNNENLEQENEQLHLEIQELKQRIESVQAQLLESAQYENLQTNLQDMQRKFNEMQQQNDELSNEYNDLSSQLMDSVQEGETLRKACQQLENELDIVRAEFKALKAANSNLEEENDVLRTQLSDVLVMGVTKEIQLSKKLIASTDSEADTQSTMSQKSSGIGSTSDIDFVETHKFTEAHVNEKVENNLVAELKQQLEIMGKDNEELRVRNNALIEENERAIAEMREEITKLSGALLEKTICVEVLEKEHAEMSMVYEELQTKIKHRSSISPSTSVSPNGTLCDADNKNSQESLEVKQNEKPKNYEIKLQKLQTTLKDTQKQLVKMEIKCQQLELEMLQKLEDSADVYRDNLRKSQLEWQQERELYMQKSQELQEKLDEQNQQMKVIKESEQCQKLEEQLKAYENLVRMLDQFKVEKHNLEEQFKAAENDKHILLESNNLALSEKELLQHKVEQFEKENTEKIMQISELNENIEKLTEENLSLKKQLKILKELKDNSEKDKSNVEGKLSDIQNKYAELHVEHTQLKTEYINSELDKKEIISEKYVIAANRDKIKAEYEILNEEHKNCVIKFDRYQQLEIEHTELTKKSEQLEHEIIELQNKYAELQEEHIQLKTEKCSIESENEKILIENNEIDQKYKQLDEEHKNCTHKLTRYEERESEQSELMEKSGQLESKFIELQNKYAELQEENTQLLTEKRSIDAENEKISVENKEMDEKYKKLDEEHKNCTPKLHKYDQIEIEHSEFMEKSVQLESKLSELQNKYAELQEEHTQLKTEKRSIKAEIDKILIENNEIDQKYKKLDEEHKNCTAKVNKYEQLEIEHSELIEKSVQLESKLSELQNKYAELQEEHTQLKTEKRSIEAENEKMLIENNEIDQKYKQLDEEHKNCTHKLTKYEELESEQSELMEKSGQLESKFIELQNKYAELQEEHTQLKTEKRSIEAEIEKILIENNEIDQKYKQLDEEHKNCTPKVNKYEQLEIEHSELIEKSVQLESKLSELQNKYSEQQMEHTQLKIEILNYKTEKQQIDQKYEKLYEEHNVCASKLHKYEQLAIEHSELMEKSVQFEKKLSKLQNKHAEQQVEHTQLKTEKQQIDQKYEKLYEEHNVCASKLNKYEQLEDEHSELSELQKKFLELQEENTQIKTKNNNLEGEKAVILRKKHEVTENRDQIDKERKEYVLESKKCEKLEIEHSELKKKSDKLERKLSEIQNKYADLQVEHTQLKLEKEKILKGKDEIDDHMTTPPPNIFRKLEMDRIDRLNQLEKKFSEHRIIYTKLEGDYKAMTLRYNNSEKEVAFFQNKVEMEKTMRFDLEKKLKTMMLEGERHRKEIHEHIEKYQDMIKQQDTIQNQLREELSKRKEEYRTEVEKLKATITCLLQEKKILNERLYVLEDTLKSLKGDGITNTKLDASASTSMSTSVVFTTSPTQHQKRGSGGSGEGGSNKQKACLERKNRRLSTHDDNRKIFCDATRDVGSMTDPHVCSCAELELKLIESEKGKFISESQVVALKMALRNHPLKEENDRLMKRLKEELDRHSAEVRSLKKIIIEKTTAAAQMAQNTAAATATAAAEAVVQSIKTKICSATQTERSLEFDKLQTKETELNDIRQQRSKTIQSLEKEITQKENICRDSAVNLLPPASTDIEHESLKEELESIKGKYLYAKRVLAMRREEIEKLQKELNTLKPQSVD